MAVSSLVPATSGPTLQQVKDAAQDNWTLINSAAPSGATYQVTGLSGFRKYRLTFTNISIPGDNLFFRINGNSSNNTYAYYYAQSSTTPYQVQLLNNTSGTSGIILASSSISSITGYIDLYNADSSVTSKIIEGDAFSNSSSMRFQFKGVIPITSAVNTITLTIFPSNFNASGNISLLGVPA